MTPSEDFRRLLGDFDGPVGNGRRNEPDDVERMKRRLNFIGFLDTPKNGFSPIWDRDTDNAVFAFQRDNGLRVDGFARPGGQTDRASQDAALQRFQTFAQNVSDDDDDPSESSLDRRGRGIVDNFGKIMGTVGGGTIGAILGGIPGGAVGAGAGHIIGDLTQGQAEDAMSQGSNTGFDVDGVILRIPRRPDASTNR
jgi:hypothetical protein